jgi:hypothetical protein
MKEKNKKRNILKKAMKDLVELIMKLLVKISLRNQPLQNLSKSIKTNSLNNSQQMSLLKLNH